MNASTRTDNRQELEAARQKKESRSGLWSIKNNYFSVDKFTDFICDKGFGLQNYYPPIDDYFKTRLIEKAKQDS